MLTSGELNYVSRAQISYAYSCPNFGHRNVGRIILSVSPPHLFLLLQWLYCFHSVALSKFPFPLLSFLPSAVCNIHLPRHDPTQTSAEVLSTAGRARTQKQTELPNWIWWIICLSMDRMRGYVKPHVCNLVIGYYDTQWHEFVACKDVKFSLPWQHRMGKVWIMALNWPTQKNPSWYRNTCITSTSTKVDIILQLMH